MTILEAGLLRSVQEIYQHDDGTINKRVLEELIEDFNYQYGDYGELGFTIRGMLLYDEMARPDFVTLKKKVARDLKVQPAQRSSPQQNYRPQQRGGVYGHEQDPNFMAFDSNQGGYYGDHQQGRENPLNAGYGGYQY